MTILTAEFLYSGIIDYWGGNGDRWDDDKGCVFASYGKGTTVRDIVDSAIVDFIGGGDCDFFPTDVTDNDVRLALLASLTDKGRADYNSGDVSDFAINYADANNLDRCRDCGERVDNQHEVACAVAMYDPVTYSASVVQDEDCNEDEDCSGPIIVFLLRVLEQS